MRLKEKYRVGGKVVTGFILAFFLVLGVSAVTYFSIRNLLDTVQDLTEPNEKLQQLNGLMADVYVLDINKTERTSDKDSVSEVTRKRVKERLEWLKSNTQDSTEIKTLDEISLTISELMVVFAGLEEVRNYLANRNFTAEALKGIEIRIKRQQELSDLQFLGQVRPKDLLSSLNPKADEPDTIGIAAVEPEEEVVELDEQEDFDFEEELIEIAEDIRQVEAAAKQPLPVNSGNQDSTLLAIRSTVEKIYKDEQRLQNRFQQLEASLIAKNTEIFSQIQKMVSELQTELLNEYNNQNQSAYQLTYTVSWILGILVFLGVVGSLGFVYSILQEVDKANLYREKLEEAKRNSDILAKTKQDFLANMSHEIRNPLHAIQGYQKALEKSGLKGNPKEFVERIGFASDTLLSVVNDILDFSKLEAGQIHIVKEPFDAGRLFISIKRFFELKAQEKNLYFNWNIDLPQENWLLGDQLRINQIMNNLLGNSLKFTQSGGIKVDISWAHKLLRIQISDTGMGMTPEIKQHIFKEFNQGDTAINRKFGGTGLGLAIVKKMIDKLEGTIRVESEVGRGTVILIDLPSEQVEAMQKETDQLLDYSLEGMKVLVVDDDAIGLQLLKMILESKGARVIDINGGVHFKNKFIPVDFDIAIVDIQMPEVSGLEVVKILRAKEQYRMLPVIAMTANVFVEEERNIHSVGFDGLILKPFNENEIVNQIGLLLGLEPKISNQENDNKKLPDLIMPEYDLTDLHKFCMGDHTMLMETIQDIIWVTKEEAKDVEAALGNLDFGKIREIVHKWSSRLGQMKIDCARLAFDIEVALKNGKTVETTESILKLLKETHQVIEKIQSDWNLELAS
ncbi:ATP-binding protein [Aquiflexum sp. TKW24L]|uniref:hybrid sensor histidine kinase/response regulator n=1 Tax=Aquiflexum sp. TKW24L TaxID=2942212 RepID=UPI0020C156FF|nr:ATP-binding protein [Aquiflexum sp. TKW24L]MCL6258342.1 ATP-binding protein [Aquiflexum sp. TKW24L]